MSAIGKELLKRLINTQLIANMPSDHLRMLKKELDDPAAPGTLYRHAIKAANIQLLKRGHILDVPTPIRYVNCDVKKKRPRRKP